MITVIDYGMGNIGSILNMLRHLDIPSSVAKDGHGILSAEKLVLPGVGSFDAGMDRLRGMGFIEPMTEAVRVRNRPILGICLGMQLFTRRSDEGASPGLGWIAADTLRLPIELADGSRQKLPHMGWNSVAPASRTRLFAGSEEGSRFYFVHSYRVVCDDDAIVAATSTHGVPFTAAFESGPIFGVQFHPEKSHRFGMRLLRNFAGI